MAIQSGHVRLLVSDFKACFLFYRDILGLACQFGDENDVYADFSDVHLALFRQDFMAAAVGTSELPANAICQDRAALILGVDNIDAVCVELVGRGVTLVTQPEDRSDWMIRTAHFRDPDGNLVEINQSL